MSTLDSLPLARYTMAYVLAGGRGSWLMELTDKRAKPQSNPSFTASLEFFPCGRNESFDILPATQRVSEDMWYTGTADAVFQNIDVISSYAPERLIILAGDHIYKMDYTLMLQQHEEQDADVTIGCFIVPRPEAIDFGVMAVSVAN